MKILLIRFSSLGDVVFTLPLARALKSFGANVAWAVEAPFAPLVEGAAFVDTVLPVRTRVGRHAPFAEATRREIRTFLEAARAFAPDVVVDAQGLLKSAWVTFLVPAARKIGFGPSTVTERINCLATREWVGAKDRPHAVDRGLALAEYLTGKDGFERLPDVGHLVRRPDEEVDGWLDRRALRPFALLQPWSSRPSKEWPAASVFEVGGALLDLGIDPIVKWGPSERERAAALVAESDGRLVLAPAAGIAATARLASRGAICIGADSGPTHLAAAAGAPTLALFGPTDPARFGPVGLRAAAVGGRGTDYNRRGKGSLPTTDEILRAARSLLA